MMAAGRKLHPVLRDQTGKMLKRPVIGSFRIIRKAAGGQLSGTQMTAQTVTADAFT